MFSGIMNVVAAATCKMPGDACTTWRTNECCPGYICYDEVSCVDENIFITPYATVEGPGSFPPVTTPMTFVQNAGQENF